MNKIHSVLSLSLMATLLASLHGTALGETRGSESSGANDGSVVIRNLRVPLPETLSAAMRDRLISHPWPSLLPAQMEDFLQKIAITRNSAALSKYHVHILHESWSGIPVNIVIPESIAKGAESSVLLHIHGGGFSLCAKACSYSEALPIAGLAGIRVVSVDYTLVPQARYPVALRQIVSVYRKLLTDHRPDRIAIFGSSAGAILTAEVTASLISEGLPVPAALGLFSGDGDLSQFGDTANLYTTSGFASDGSGAGLADIQKAYAGDVDLRDPLLSPAYSDLRKFPPTLLMSSTRDMLLSATGNFERALHRAGVKTEMAIFDGLYHTFWLDPGTPEADQALARQACFLAAHVGADPRGIAACLPST